MQTIHWKKNPAIWLLIYCLGVIPGNDARAHSLGQSYIFLQIYERALQGRFEITFADANRVLGGHGAEEITAENLALHIPRLQDYYRTHVAFASGSAAYPLRFSGFGVLKVKKLADYITLDFTLLQDAAEIPRKLDVDYRVMFAQDPRHRAFLVIEHFWKANLFHNERHFSLVFDVENTRQSLDLTHFSMFSGFLGVVKMGIKHIWIGIDHILFLVALILPSVMVRRREEWEPVENFKPALIYVIKIITLFTVAHSITLSLAALGVFELPPRLVESVIAISIAIAALDIIYPIFRNQIWLIVFGFGLFHGFGFASVLSHLGVLGEHMALSLFGFNLGVEIGQVVVICLVFPAFFLVRRMAFYRPVMLKTGAAVLILVAMFWFIERAFEFEIPLAQLLK